MIKGASKANNLVLKTDIELKIKLNRLEVQFKYNYINNR